jgi:zinc protease
MKFFEGTGYGHITTGTVSGLNNLTISDVKDFYKNYYTKDNYFIGIGGSYSSDFVNKLQKDLQSGLPSGEPVKPGKPNYQKIDGLDVTIINKQAAATAISMGYPINVLRGDDDWYALAVANSWFGEHRNSSSHLYQVIREDRGLNYGDYSYIENFPRGGQLQMPPVNVPRKQQIFEIWIRPVPNETRHFVLRAAIRELELLAENGLTKDQFELTKNFLSKYILHFAPSTSERLGYALDDKFYGLSESHLEKFGRMLDRMTHEQVNNAVKKHLQYKNMKIAIITTDAEALKNNLINESESPIEYSSPKSDSIYVEDKIIQVYPLNIPEDKIEIINVEELFN